MIAGLSLLRGYVFAGAEGAAAGAAGVAAGLALSEDFGVSPELAAAETDSTLLAELSLPELSLLDPSLLPDAVEGLADA